MQAPARPTPPGPRSRWPGQNLLAFRRSPTAYLYNAARLGDVVDLRLGGYPLYLLNHPDLVRDVLVTHHRKFIKSPLLRRARALLGDGLLTSEGDLHLRQRRLIQPAFHRQIVGRYADAMVAHTLRMVSNWQDGGEYDIHSEMMRLTMIIAGQTLFGADVERDAPHIGQAVTTLMSGFGRLWMPFWEHLQRLPLPGNRAIEQAGRYLDETIQAMVTERRAANLAGGPGDVLDLLLAARDDEGDGGGMSDDLIRDEVLTLFLAGHETTANALSWALHLLAQYANAEDRLHAEVSAVLGGRVPGAADVERLVYTRQVFAEAMRLYPPSWSMGREAVEDYQAGEYLLPAGSVVLLSPWVMHHDARYYPFPWRFDPDRWTPEAQATRPRYAYFPFGAGPRVCVGESFAWMEGVLVLAMIAQRWQMRPAQNFKYGLLPQITLRPRYGIHMRLFRRPDAPQ